MSACVRIVFTSAAASLLLLHAAGCGGSGKTTDPAAEMTLGEVNSATRFVAAPRTSCDELVKSIEAAVAHQDIDAFNALIDEEQIVDRILAGLDAGDTFRTSFMQGISLAKLWVRCSEEETTFLCEWFSRVTRFIRCFDCHCRNPAA